MAKPGKPILVKVAPATNPGKRQRAPLMLPPGSKQPEMTIIDNVRMNIAHILAQHACGKSLDEIGQKLKQPQSGVQIRAAIHGDEELVKRWNVAMEHRAHWMIEQVAVLAEIESRNPMGGRKTAIDAYFKLAEKLAPKIYGQKATIALTGEHGGAVEVNANVSPSDAYKAMLGG
jgi:hypothetical protein